MGSCASKDKHPSHEGHKQNPRSRPGTGDSKASAKTGSGQVLGGNGENTQTTKEAAARAAETRYQSHQDKLKNSQAKLKAMEKISKKEKGLA